jgi:hypothetical protein
MLRIFHKYMGCPDKKITTIPTFLYSFAMKDIVKKQRAEGHEGGLNMVKFTDIMCASAFIDKSTIVDLGVLPDDIDKAIGESVKLCLLILDGKANTVEMRGE